MYNNKVSVNTKIALDSKKEKKAREIAEIGDYEEIRKRLRDNNLLSYAKERIKVLYNKELSLIPFINEKDMEILAILELFDVKTFKHSINTYFVAKEKVEKPLLGSVFLKSLIDRKGIDLDVFYRACIFHDIGKIAIPKFLLNSQFTDNHWAQAFVMLEEDVRNKLIKKYNIEIPEEFADNPESVMNYFIEKRVRGAWYVPVGKIFSKKQIEELEKRDFSRDMSLLEIMRKHEDESERILNLYNYETEGKLAGSHHNYKIQLQENHSHLILSDIIHLADIQNALQSNRPYHLRKPRINIMAFMVDDAKRGTLDPCLTYIWVRDEISKIDPIYIEQIRNHDESHENFEYLEDRKRELEEIESYLSNIEISNLCKFQ